MTRRGVLAVTGAATILISLLVGAAPVGAISANGAAHSKRVCAAKPAGLASCLAEVATDAGLKPLVTTTFQNGYQPRQLRTAYGLGAGVPSTKAPLVAIVGAYAHPRAAADLGVYRNRFGLGTARLTQKNQFGGSIATVAGNTLWGTEEMLDLEMVSAICPSCRLLYVGARSNSFSDLAAAVDTAASLGAKVISNSYGANEFFGETDYASHYSHPGVAITVSSGDNGYGVLVPAAYNTVTAVGGTTLSLDTNGNRLGETVWSGAGSGCSAYIAKPAWQIDPACPTNRTVADVAAVADPSTGVAVYNSYGSTGGANWYVFGGTSVAAPIIGAVYALSGNTAGVPASLAYSKAGSLFDVTSGSNGTCDVTTPSAAYLCTGGALFDGPTGNGTPRGDGTPNGLLPF